MADEKVPALKGSEMTWTELAARPDVDPQTRHAVESSIEARKCTCPIPARSLCVCGVKEVDRG